MAKKLLAGSLGKRIRRIRKAQKMSQAEFGKMIGASQRAVSYWEHGITLIGTEHLMSIKEVFNVDMSELDPFIEWNSGE